MLGTKHKLNSDCVLFNRIHGEQGMKRKKREI